MAWSIEFDRKAERELDQIDPPVAHRIAQFLFERVARLENPRSIGEALAGPDLGKYWKYRVGDYRIIVSIEDAAVRILVVRVAHRSEAYR